MANEKIEAGFLLAALQEIDTDKAFANLDTPTYRRALLQFNRLMRIVKHSDHDDYIHFHDDA